VTGIDFADPVWLRLGFINEFKYNWDAELSDIDRASRDRRFWALVHRWKLEMPWFVMYRFPAEIVGSALCWRGDVLWEGADGHFDPIRHQSMTCRTLALADAGRRIFGVAIRQDPPLAMRLEPTTEIWLWQLVRLRARAHCLCGRARNAGACPPASNGPAFHVCRDHTRRGLPDRGELYRRGPPVRRRR
jgi:hypothetical protein